MLKPWDKCHNILCYKPSHHMSLRRNTILTWMSLNHSPQGYQRIWCVVKHGWQCKNPVLGYVMMNWNYPFQLGPILSVICDSPDMVVVVHWAVMVGKNVCREESVGVCLWGGEKGMEKLPAYIHAVIIKLRGWAGELREACVVEYRTGAF